MLVGLSLCGNSLVRSAVGAYLVADFLIFCLGLKEPPMRRAATNGGEFSFSYSDGLSDEEGEDDNDAVNRDQRSCALKSVGIRQAYRPLRAEEISRTHLYSCCKCRRSFATPFELEEGPKLAQCDSCNDCEIRIRREVRTAGW